METATELLPCKVIGRWAVEHLSELDMLSLISVHAYIGHQLTVNNVDTLASLLFCNKRQQ